MTRILLIIIFLSPLSVIVAQYRSFSNIHDTINPELSILLEKNGFGKVTYYYDENTKKEGKWSFYPMAKLSNSLTAVCVSNIPNIEKMYTFLIFYDSNSRLFADTLGPFYDSMISAIDVKIKENTVYTVKVRLTNPPERENPRFTIIEYKRINGRFIEGKTYDKK